MGKKLALKIYCYECDGVEMIYSGYTIENLPKLECPKCKKVIMLELEFSY